MTQPPSNVPGQPHEPVSPSGQQLQPNPQPVTPSRPASAPVPPNPYAVAPTPVPPAAQPAPQARMQAGPYGNFDTNRSLTKYILLGLITFGIYTIWVTARSGEDLNAIASRWDNRRTMNYWLMVLVFSWLTLGIGPLVWFHNSTSRISRELQRRGIYPKVTTMDFWLWGVLGSFIIVGPFIFGHKWLHSMNDLCADFNQRG